jgi:Domain of unknown function (DUF3291)
MDMPWTTLAPADPGREYLAMLSYLPLRVYRKIPSFFWYTMQIQRQLRETAGAIGYSMRAKVWNRNFWTLSVWENERALMDFVGKAPHREAMKKIGPYMGAVKFTKWKVPGSRIPLDWADAVRRESKES